MPTQTNPFESLDQLIRRMRAEFEDAATALEATERPTMLRHRMAIDMVDEAERYVVTADLPGFAKEDIDVSVTDSTLHIVADHEEATDVEEADYVHRERSHRSLRRSIALLEPVERDGISASFTNGVLTITLPKTAPTEAEGPLHIDID